MNNRLQRLREIMTGYRLDALVVSNPVNCTYLSGFTGTSATLLIDHEHAYLFTDFRYTEQAKKQCPGYKVIEIKDKLYIYLNELLSRRGIEKPGLEADYLTYESYCSFREHLQVRELVPVTGMVQQLRTVKDREEIDAISKSMHILDRSFNYILGRLKPGISEKEIALELEFFARREGAEGTAFTFIVASGPRSALPHGTASRRVMQAGDLVTIDFGVMYEGYASDMTRTLVLGNFDDQQQKIYNIVLEAQLAGLAAVKAGVKACEVDRAAREVIEGYGYGPYFGHSTGHGVGLEVHEKPRLSGNDETVLEPGMVVTVEPGIYLPRWGGVRIEDTVVVEEKGCRVLCHSPKDELICI